MIFEQLQMEALIMQNENSNLDKVSEQLITIKQNDNSNLDNVSEQSVTVEQSENSNLKKLFDQSATKWIVGASLSILLLISTFLLIGLKSQYVEIDFCVATVNCSQTPKQVTDNAIDIEEDYLDDPTLSSKPIKITVKPSGAAIVSGVTSTAAIAVLISLGIISLPVELAVVIGALIGSGTYFALKTLY